MPPAPLRQDGSDEPVAPAAEGQAVGTIPPRYVPDVQTVHRLLLQRAGLAPREEPPTQMAVETDTQQVLPELQAETEPLETAHLPFAHLLDDLQILGQVQNTFIIASTRKGLVYPEALILTLALLQVAQQASYRQLRFGQASNLLSPRARPAWGTLLYRLKTIPESRWHAWLTWLAEQGLALEQPAKPLETPLVLVDGTGWGFNKPSYAWYRRGAARRRRRSHGRGVVLGYWGGGAVW